MPWRPLLGALVLVLGIVEGSPHPLFVVASALLLGVLTVDELARLLGR